MSWQVTSFRIASAVLFTTVIDRLLLSCYPRRYERPAYRLITIALVSTSTVRRVVSTFPKALFQSLFSTSVMTLGQVNSTLRDIFTGANMTLQLMTIIVSSSKHFAFYF